MTTHHHSAIDLVAPHIDMANTIFGSDISQTVESFLLREIESISSGDIDLEIGLSSKNEIKFNLLSRDRRIPHKTANFLRDSYMAFSAPLQRAAAKKSRLHVSLQIRPNNVSTELYVFMAPEHFDNFVGKDGLRVDYRQIFFLGLDTLNNTTIYLRPIERASDLIIPAEEIPFQYRKHTNQYRRDEYGGHYIFRKQVIPHDDPICGKLLRDHAESRDFAMAGLIPEATLRHATFTVGNGSYSYYFAVNA